MPKRKVKGPEWRKLEQAVAAHYVALGYTVSPNTNLDGSQLDLLCTSHVNGVGLVTVGVEVKHRTAGQIGVDEVRRFKSTAIGLRDDAHIQAAVLVANVPFSQDARAALYRVPWLTLMEFGDLEQDLFNFRDALIRTRFEYEATPIFPRYVPLAASHRGEIYDDAVALLGDLVAKGGLTVLMADFGMGKTTAVDRLFYELICERVTDASKPYPIKLKLRTLLQYPDLWTFISDNLRDNQYLRPTRAQFERRLERGEMAIFLDGFDEIKTNADAKDRAVFLQQLSPLLSSPCACVIATRSTYFKTFDEMVRLIAASAASTPYTPRIDRKRTGGEAILRRLGLARPETPNREELGNIVVLNSLTREARRAYLDTYADEFRTKHGVDVDEVHEFLGKIYNLPELMQRPLLLEMVVTTVLAGKIDIASKDVGHVGPSMIYDDYTTICAHRDYKMRPGGLDWEERLAASRAIAMGMLQRNVIELGSAEVAQLIEQLPFVQRRVAPIDGSRRQDMEEILTDVRVCSFLSSETGGQSFGFKHKSFFEFFVAQNILMERVKRPDAFQLFEDAPLTKEILYFLGSFARDQPEFGEVVRNGVNASPVSSRQTYRLCRRIAFAAGTLLANLSIVGQGVQDVALENLELPNVEMRNLELQRVRLHDLDCDGWILDRCHLQASSCESLRFVNPKLDATLTKTTLDAIHIAGGAVGFSGQDWSFRDSTISAAHIQLSGSATFVDLRITSSTVGLGGLRLARGSSMTIEGGTVFSRGPDRWSPSQGVIRLSGCRLDGLWIPAHILASCMSEKDAEAPIIEIIRCSGIIFSEYDLEDELDKDRQARFRARHPDLTILAEPAIRRAIRRRNGERVEVIIPSETMTSTERDIYSDGVIKREDAKLDPALHALLTHGATDNQAELYIALLDATFAKDA